jgi:subtilisin family serine protease
MIEAQPISVLLEIDPQSLSTTVRASMADLSIEGARLDAAFTPVPLSSGAVSSAGMAARTADESTIVVRATVALEDLQKLEASNQVVAIWSDPPIAPFPTDCTPAVSTGGASDVARALGADRLWASTGFRGEGMVIGIVDGGVDGGRFPVVGGWSPDASNPPGSSAVEWGEHGNMCAFDALIAAPEAAIHDYAIGRSVGIGPLLSNAFQSFHRALLQYRRDGTPHVLSNSWGLYQQSWDPFPPEHASNYTHNPRHPLTRKMLELLDAGMLVSFAAGNCGSACPDDRCVRDTGPGHSIWGANGHERAITVGAVNLRRDWVGYSSEGPASLHREKPDLCGYTHFSGYFPSDTGTSAANPVVAGGLALLRGLHPGLAQDAARTALRSTALTRSVGAWDSRLGAGIIDLFAAHGALP